MSPCKILLQVPTLHGATPDELVLRATIRNAGDKPVRLNRARLSCASLVLEVLDAKGRPVALPPPPVPDERLLASGEDLAPGAAVTFEYTNFLDRGLLPGIYRVRFKASPSTETASPESGASEWVEVTLTQPLEAFPVGKPVQPPPGPPSPLFDWIRQVSRWIVCAIRQILGLRCDAVLEQEVDQAVTETISNAPAGSEAWNGTYGWRSRFHVRVDQAQCRVTVTVRVRLRGGAITAAQRAAIESAIEAKWNNKFKLCCDGCCCRGGYAIVTDIQFVDTGEHQTVDIGGSTTDMTHWAANDNVDVTHEFGHMLGAPDEYFTVNGTDYGAGRQASGAIMNNPANNPAARNYNLIRDAVRGLLGTTCRTIPQGESC